MRIIRNKPEEGGKQRPSLQSPPAQERRTRGVKPWRGRRRPPQRLARQRNLSSTSDRVGRLRTRLPSPPANTNSDARPEAPPCRCAVRGHVLSPVSARRSGRGEQSPRLPSHKLHSHPVSVSLTDSRILSTHSAIGMSLEPHTTFFYVPLPTPPVGVPLPTLQSGSASLDQQFLTLLHGTL